jgi:hypothetical protein
MVLFHNADSVTTALALDVQSIDERNGLQHPKILA